MLFFGKKAVTLHRDLKTTPITYNNIMYTYKYPHPAVTTDCVVFGFDGNSLSLLLIKRGIEPYKGTWALPGGFMNMDETAEQGALRELQEETGVNQLILRELICVTDHCYRRNGLWHLKHTWWFDMLYNNPTDLTPQKEEDITKAVWVAKSSLPPYLHNTYPSIAEVFREVRI